VARWSSVLDWVRRIAVLPGIMVLPRPTRWCDRGDNASLNEAVRLWRGTAPILTVWGTQDLAQHSGAVLTIAKHYQAAARHGCTPPQNVYDDAAAAGEKLP